MRLIDKDELFNSIFNELEDEEGCMHICKAGLLDKIDEFPEVNQWISVKDELPKEKELVLAIGERGGMFIGELIPPYMFANPKETGKANFYVPNGNNCRKATHWMPLPEPPKE